jgi:hypothetical protein
VRQRQALRGVLSAILAITFQQVAAASPEVDAKSKPWRAPPLAPDASGKRVDGRRSGTSQAWRSRTPSPIASSSARRTSAVSVMAAASANPSAAALELCGKSGGTALARLRAPYALTSNPHGGRPRASRVRAKSTLVRAGVRGCRASSNHLREVGWRGSPSRTDRR